MINDIASEYALNLLSAIEYIEGNMGAAYEMEIAPRWMGDRIEYAATLTDEYGEATDAHADTLVGSIILLARNFADWLDEQDNY